MNLLNSIWTSFKRSVKGFDSPGQLAIGIAFGMVIGLIPKDSLFPYAIGVMAILSSANLLCVIISAIAFSWISPLLDPAAHSIGAWLLTFDPFEPAWAFLFQLPVIPWTRFDNTVVTGTLTIGLLMAGPMYMLSFHFFEKFGSAVFAFVSNTRVARWLIGNPTTHLQES